MNSIVKLTKQGVRDLDSGRKKIRVVAPVLAADEVAGIDAELGTSGDGTSVIGPADGGAAAVPVVGVPKERPPASV